MKIYSKLILAAVAVACGVSTGRAGEPDAKNRYDFGFIEQTNPWLTSSNGAGLRWLTISNTSKAEAYFTKSNGDFKNYSESADSYQFGLNTESYYTLGKVTLYGKIAYDNFMGQDMTGSVWIDPYDAPFNIVEFYDKDAGEKNREHYRVAAGVGYDLARALRIGARFDYGATNYTKRKDLRHTNTQLDMNLSLGLTYTFCGRFTLGADYIYARKIEELKFDTFGTTDQQYYVLIAPGAFYGNWEQYGGRGYTEASYTPPLFNEYQGAAVQLAYNSDRVDAFYEFTYKSRDGYYGFRHNNYRPYFTEHESDQFRHKIYAALKGEHSVHSVTASASYEALKNYEMVYETGRDEGGNYYLDYFGRNLNADRETLTVTGRYQSAWGIEGYMPRWSVTVDGLYWQQNVTASLFPFYRDQKIRHAAVDVTLHRTFFAGSNLFGVSLKGGYAKGGGFEYADGTYLEPSASTVVPKQTEWYMHREFEYLTASRFNGSIAARYTRMLGKGVNAYIDLKYNLTTARKITYLDGKNFNVFQLTVGCSF